MLGRRKQQQHQLEGAPWNVLTNGTHYRILPIVTYDWSEDKNRQLRERRGISFEEIVLCIQENRVVTVLEHPNEERYPRQRLYLIEYKKQIYVVPFVLDVQEETIFLKTVYPSRHYTKKYLGARDEGSR